MNCGLKPKPERLIEMAMPSMSEKEYIKQLEKLLKRLEDRINRIEMKKVGVESPWMNWSGRPINSQNEMKKDEANQGYWGEWYKPGISANKNT